MNSRTVLVVSIVLNLCLLLAVRGLMKSKGGAEATPPPAADPVVKEVEVKSEPQIVYVTNSVPVVKAAGKNFDWQSVEADDYREYIANLRAIGCPEETIRDIIKADVTQLFDQRARDKRKDEKPYEFWKTGNMFAEMFKKEHIEEQQAADREKREMLKTLLGEDVPIKPDLMAAFNPFDRALGFLSDDKQAYVMEAFQKLQVSAAEKFGSGAPDSQDLKEIQQMKMQMEADLAKRLSPEEYERYQFTMSDTANMMRMQLHGFEPTEKEFRDIFAMKKAFDDEWGPYGMSGLNSDEMKQHNEAKKALDDQIKKALGESRWKDYELAQDHQFKELYRVADRAGMGTEAAAQALEVRKAAEKAARQIRDNTSLTPDQRRELLAPIQQETERELTTIFGDHATRYLDSRQGDWLRKMDEVKSATEFSVSAETIVVP